MIQRIQSVYLLLTTLIATLFLSGSIIGFENGSVLRLTGVFREIGAKGFENVGHYWPLTLLLIIVPVCSFILIFLYKNRKLQMRFTLFLIVLILITVVLCGYYARDYMKAAQTNIIYDYKLILPVLMHLFPVLAYRGMRKDEEIVRSYDRLR